MMTMKKRNSSIAPMALLLLSLAACKGESPTAPPPGGGPPNNTPPPSSGIALTITTSNTDPLVDSSVVITAQVTQNGQPVPNGTAVQFSSTGGALDTTGGTAIIKTTTNGIATVTLTSSVAEVVRVQATVNNVTRQVDVTFRSRPVVEPPPSTAPSIDSVTPAIGSPAGGQTIRITGTNFNTPVRVLFDVGLPLPVEAFVVAVTNTTIDVITPPVLLGAGQQLIADIIVITQAGTATEQRAEREDAFTFRNEQLTPVIITTSPNSGPVIGGTIVTIFGEAFQAPVQVMFGAAEAKVLTVNYNQITVEAPAGRDTSPNGSEPVTGFVPITVRNIASNRQVTFAEGFRYIAQIRIIAISPSEGPVTGGTRVTIDGIGFVAPVAVTIGGEPAQPISVTGTKIVAITAGVGGCSDATGPVSVTNISDGSSADFTGDFTFRGTNPTIVNVSPSSVTAGGTITVTVANALPGINRIKLGTRAVFPSSSSINEDTRIGTFTVAVPSNFEFETESCIEGGVTGEREIAQDIDVTYESVTFSGCTDTAQEALTVNPANTDCVLPPPAEVVLVLPAAGCADGGSVDVASGTGTATITFRNDGGRELSLTPSVSGANASDFTIAPATLNVGIGATGSFTVTFNPSAADTRNATASFATNDPDENPVNVCLTGIGTVPAP